MPALGVAKENILSLTGNYIASSNSFVGTAEYIYDEALREDLYFHLPPNWYRTSDRRRQFSLSSDTKGVQIYKRRSLDKLKNHFRKNLHLPYGIIIKSVHLNGSALLFELKNNPSLVPRLNPENSLLLVHLDKERTDQRSEFKLQISFETFFRDLPKGSQRILWDYLPRPVTKIDHQLDFGDHFRRLINIVGPVSPESSSSGRVQQFGGAYRIPVSFQSKWTFTKKPYYLSLDETYNKDKVFLSKRLDRVLSFLKTEGWVNSDVFFRFIVWDGPLQVSGNVILLPRVVFRYGAIYYKTFEVLLLKGIIESELRRRFIIDSYHNPWIIPALQAELIRSYFSKVYGNNSKFFPWTTWLNPDFYEENTLKSWLNHRQDKTTIAASEALIHVYDSRQFHPWYEKGFHFFRTALDSENGFEERIHPLLKEILIQQNADEKILSTDYIYDYFLLNENERLIGAKWLGIEGRIDYFLEDVTFKKGQGKVKTSVKIANNGTISPPFFLEMSFKKEDEVRQLISSGAGQYEFETNAMPIGIKIDSQHLLLEDNLLNNHWDLPLKIRPIWDFPSAENWIFAVSPMISGNTFDQNLIGLSFNLSYLSQTRFFIDGWRSGKNNVPLWESSIEHYGYPWPGSEIYLKSSELNSSYAKIFSLKQIFVPVNKNLWLEAIFSEEKPDHIPESEIPERIETWQIGQINFSTPFHIGDFLDWTAEFHHLHGRSAVDDAFEFYQDSISSGLKWYFDSSDFHATATANYSYGTTPLQKKFAIGGPEGLPGFPREINLLFDQRRIIELGFTFPPSFTHSDLNLFRLGWLNRIQTSLNAHWGKGSKNNQTFEEEFKDIELRFNLFVEWFNMYSAEGLFAIAQPLEHERYKDYRLILFSNWVF